MTGTNELVSQIYIKLDGTALQRPVVQKLIEVVVDQHSHLPDMFTIRLDDPNLKILDEGPFDLAKEVEITSETSDRENVVLIKGEITALEPNFGEGMNAELVVRGYDKSHRLFRETSSIAYLNKKDSDLASEIAQRAGLQAKVETTNTVYDHIFQHNQSDLSFLLQRAWRIGFECFVSDGKLHFRKPPSGGEKVKLIWGDDLLSFRPRLTLAEQVDEVTVRGWDVDRQQPIVGRAENGRLFPGIEESDNVERWRGAIGGGKLVVVDQPVVTQAEADLLAAARLDELSGAFIEAEGVAFRRPDIKAGRMVELKALGNRFSGDYLVTSASHIYSLEGLRTVFNVRGMRTGLLSEQLNDRAPLNRWPGVVTAIVTNTEDPKDWGRVKVKYPWMTEEAESDWARVVGIGGGPKAGLYVMPEVGDEVLVTFGHGDFSQPFVLGGLWNGQHAIPPEGAGADRDEKALVRIWRSRKGHRMVMYDNADQKVEIVTADGGLSITLDDSRRKITIKSNKEIEIKADGDLMIQAGGNMDLQASGQVNVKGATINLN
jgi:phage protein D